MMTSQYLFGLCRRFEEEYERTVADIRATFPSWKSPPRAHHQTESERAVEAASGLATTIGISALLDYRGKLPGEDDQSEVELAIAVAYSQLVFAAINTLLMEEGLTIKMKPMTALVTEITYLTEAFRSRCFQRGMKMAMEILEDQQDNVKEWRDTLFRIVGIYLLLGARRNPELEVDIQKAMVGHSRGLFGAVR